MYVRQFQHRSFLQTSLQYVLTASKNGIGILWIGCRFSCLATKPHGTLVWNQILHLYVVHGSTKTDKFFFCFPHIYEKGLFGLTTKYNTKVMNTCNTWGNFKNKKLFLFLGYPVGFISRFSHVACRLWSWRLVDAQFWSTSIY